MHNKEEYLVIHKRVGITKEVYNKLRKLKKKEGISMAKIVCNAILEKSDHEFKMQEKK